jgi:hypothetical protein
MTLTWNGSALKINDKKGGWNDSNFCTSISIYLGWPIILKEW